jgi:xylan 1,4-beta-xylosidase
MSGRRLQAESDGAVSLDTILSKGVRDQADVGALASLDGKQLCVLVWHYHDDDEPAPAVAVELTLQGLDPSLKQARLTHHRVDGEHSNAYTSWQKMGSPPAPSTQQLAALRQASGLALLESSKGVELQGGQTILRFSMPRQAVSLLQLEW